LVETKFSAVILAVSLVFPMSYFLAI